MLFRTVTAILLTLLLLNPVAAQGPYKLATDEEWDAFKDEVVNAARYIAAKDKCDNDPVDEIIKLLTMLAGAVVSSDAQMDLYERVFLEEASTFRPPCDDPMGKLQATISGMAGIKRIHHFWRQGYFPSAERPGVEKDLLPEFTFGD